MPTNRDRIPEVWRDLLASVADGSIAPEEAAARLADLEEGQPDAGEPEKFAEQAPTTPREDSQARLVRIVGGDRPVIVQGDPAVATAVADGPHRAYGLDDALVVEGSPVERDERPGYVYRRRSGVLRRTLVGDGASVDVALKATRGALGLAFEQLGAVVRGQEDRARAMHRSTFELMSSLARSSQDPLEVSVNPSLPLALELSVAHPATVEGVVASITGSVRGCNLSIEGVTGALDLEASGSIVWLSGRFPSGGRVRARASGIQLYVQGDGPLRVRSRARQGSVKVPKKARTVGRDLVIGAASQTTPVLSLDIAAGSVEVRTD